MLIVGYNVGTILGAIGTALWMIPETRTAGIVVCGMVCAAGWGMVGLAALTERRQRQQDQQVLARRLSQ